MTVILITKVLIQLQENCKPTYPKIKGKKQRGECFSHFSVLEKYFEINKTTKEKYISPLNRRQKTKNSERHLCPKTVLAESKIIKEKTTISRKSKITGQY